MGREGGEKTRGRGANENEKPRKESRRKGEELCWGDAGGRGRDPGETWERPRRDPGKGTKGTKKFKQETLAWLPCSLSKMGEK